MMRTSMAKTSLALMAVFGAWLSLASTPVSAKVAHPFVSRFNGADAPGGPFGEIVASDAVDQASGDVYVLESNAFELGVGVVDRFDANGVYSGVQITGGETPQGSFALGLGSGVAVDNSLGLDAGDVYVADSEHGVVDRFDSEGRFVCQITAAKPTTPAGVEHECDGAAGSETPSGSIVPAGLAVDSSGDVYVADNAHDVIDEFGSAGNFLRQIEDPHLSGEMGTIAVDPSGALFVVISEAAVVELNSAGSFVTTLDSNRSRGVAVDPATGHIYVSGKLGFQTAIFEYQPSGALLDTFGEGSIGGEAVALADSPNGRIYATEWNVPGKVFIFRPDVVVPYVASEAATGVGRTSAILNGHVDPDAANGGGEVTACQFEYVTDKQFQEHPQSRYEGAVSAPCAPATPYSGPRAVSANVTVAPSTTYHVRLVAANADGSNDGEGEPSPEVAFTTFGLPSIDAQSSTAGTTGVTLRAQVNPFGSATTCQLQYTDAASFESSGYANATTLPCTPSALGSGFGDQSASATLTGLSVGHTYHYRFVVSNQAGTTTGSDQTFATFGLKSFDVQVLDKSGQPDTQAGDHPYKLVVAFSLNTTTGSSGRDAADGNLKDVETELPPGLIGVPTATPKCTHFDLQAGRCSGSTQVGVLEVETASHDNFVEPLYNLVPPAGLPAQFGIRIEDVIDVYIDANVRTGGDYGVTADVLNASTASGVTGSRAELWGVPADPSHDPQRVCASVEGCASSAPAQPFLVNPSSCTAETATLRVDSWQAPGVFSAAASTLPAFTGCNRLNFTPSISVLPDTNAADSPSGVGVDLHVPQSESKALEALSTPTLRDATVKLPAGVTLNPAAANGLQACSLAQIGLDSPSEPTCPDASKVGAIEIESPLLPDTLKGSAYLAEQDNNPFGSTLALYVAAQADGALIKIAGKVEADPLTGQLTSTFEDTPPLPFSDFRLHFFGGPRAPLATPKVCGTYETTSTLTPWSAPGSGASAVQSTAFQITTGPGGGPCASPGFAPGFTAGTTSNQAGGFSPFTFTMSRNDGEQNLGTVSTTLPPGLVGMLAKVPLCGEAQANEGTCSAASTIGHVTTGVGAGPDPLFVPESGKPADPVFLTGPYKGAPFGLSVVVPAEAGPFNLGEAGRPVIVRAAINVDPVTAQVTVTSDPLPQILKGVPLDIRSVNVTIDRPEFIVNPTSCERLQITGNLTSGMGAAASLGVPYQATDCAALTFKPQFDVSTNGHTSRAGGASLDAKLAYPRGASGSLANIRSVKVDLPKQLPSRLTTLQKACAAEVFDRNPASCPAASRVGAATATTPIIPVALSGPAYFVSYGGAKFPELVVVLSGYGVTVDLHGETFISRSGITSSTFRSVPDVQIGTFELRLPQGQFSALAANGDLCKSKLTMPTEFVAQNGAVIHQSTPVAVEGCTNKVSFVSHSIKRRTLVISVSVPAKGKLKASGKGLSTESKISKGREDLKLTLHATKGGRFATRVKLSFTPSKGKRLSKSLAVKFKK
jgi:hypothetical protein